MRSDPIRTLLLPFYEGLTVEGDRPVLFLGAEAHPELTNPDIHWRVRLLCVQGFKPQHDALIRQNVPVVTTLPDGLEADLVLVRITRHKQQSLGLIAQGVSLLRPGGSIHIAGAKDDGIESIEKRVKALMGPVTSLSKHHARSFSVTRGDGPLPAELMDWAEAMRPAEHIPGFLSEPGLFSFDKIDKGSRLLASHLPTDLKGRAADFGAGWGYLSAALLEKSPALRHLDLYEADATALTCAKRTLSGGIGRSTTLGFHWADIASQTLPETHYHCIVMNPPFHAAGAQQVSLGQAFIAAAGKALKRGGRLFLVANQLLPYEAIIAKSFASSRLLAREDGFKVMEATR